MKYTPLYESQDIFLEVLEDGSYKVTLFKNKHYHGDLTFSLNGIINDNITNYVSFDDEDDITESGKRKYIKPQCEINNYGNNEDFYDD